MKLLGIVTLLARRFRGSNPSVRERLPDRRSVDRIKFAMENHKWFAEAGRYNDGRIGELFLSSAKPGELMRAMGNDMAISASIALQYGCPIEVLRDALTRTNPTDDNPTGAATPLSAAIDRFTKSEAFNG